MEIVAKTNLKFNNNSACKLANNSLVIVFKLANNSLFIVFIMVRTSRSGKSAETPPAAHAFDIISKAVLIPSKRRMMNPYGAR
jgi:hypothetical protein